MKRSLSRGAAIASLFLASAALLPAAATAQSTPPGGMAEKWIFSAVLYGYLPDIGGKMSVPVDTGGHGINVNASTILDNLKFAFMGTLEMHNGRWGAFTDVIYMDVGGSKSGVRTDTIGLPVTTTADLNFDLKGAIWTFAGEYRVISNPSTTLDVVAGARMLDVKPTLGWSFNGDLGPIPIASRSGSKQLSEAVWDGIVGIKGRYAFGDDRKWFVPYYADIGTGQSDLTWQAAGGIGYAFGWGEVFGMWRYIDYNFKSGKDLEDLNFNGPMLGVAFRW